jgi:Domain of unknown function
VEWIDKWVTITIINAIVIGKFKTLSGGFDDDFSLLENPDLGWGKLVEMGFDVIQTDWPISLMTYLEKKDVKLVSYETHSDFVIR